MNVNITGRLRTGGLVGQNIGTINNSYVKDGTINGDGSYTGGLVGWHEIKNTINNSYATVIVVGPGHYKGGIKI